MYFPYPESLGKYGAYVNEVVPGNPFAWEKSCCHSVTNRSAGSAQPKLQCEVSLNAEKIRSGMMQPPEWGTLKTKKSLFTENWIDSKGSAWVRTTEPRIRCPGVSRQWNNEDKVIASLFFSHQMVCLPKDIKIPNFSRAFTTCHCAKPLTHIIYLKLITTL